MGKLKEFLENIGATRSDSPLKAISAHERDYFYHSHTTMLLEIGKAMKSTFTEPEKTLHLITSSITLILNTERSILFLLDKTSGGLRIASYNGLMNQRIVETTNINVGEGFVGDIAKHKEPAMNNRECTIITGLDVKNVIGAPIIYQDEVFGVITADSKRDGSNFTENELKLLSILANLAAIDIQSSNTHRKMKQKNERLTALCEISKAMTSTLELQKLLDLIVDKAIALTNGTSGSIMLIEEGSDILQIMSSRGLQSDVSERIKLHIGEGITGSVAQTGKPIIENDVSKNPKYVVAAREVRSELAVPMLLEDKIIGVINVDSTRLNAFTTDDEELLATLSAQATVAINNAKTFAKLSGKSR
ncbi:MAG: GAF domain-containing protein [Candidatus Schekmanbacteria bacterium]|nr:GAF domain-containing protein [Candidatus Schekmanbacteria bacterium]